MTTATTEMTVKQYHDRLERAELKARIHSERSNTMASELTHLRLSLNAALARIKEQEVTITLADATIAGLRARLVSPCDDTDLTTEQEEAWLARGANA